MRHFETLGLNKGEPSHPISPQYLKKKKKKKNNMGRGIQGPRHHQVTEEEEGGPEREELLNERERKEETRSGAPLVPIKFSFIHLAAQRCIAPICHAQELDHAAEFGSGVGRFSEPCCAVFCMDSLTR